MDKKLSYNVYSFNHFFYTLHEDMFHLNYNQCHVHHPGIKRKISYGLHVHYLMSVLFFLNRETSRGKDVSLFPHINQEDKQGFC